MTDPLDQLAEAARKRIHRSPRRSNRISIFIGLAIGIVALGVLIGLSLARPGIRKINSPRSVDPDGLVEAGDLIALYHQNELSADDHFKGRIVRISGKVRSVSQSLGALYVHVESEREFGIWTVQCRFSESARPTLASLRVGDRIRVSGQCEGMLISSVSLKDCVLE